MPETLPVVGGDPDVLLTAIAKAAARLAAQDAGRCAGASLAPDDIEEIARRCVVDAFKQFGVDLDKIESVEEFREVLAHARRNRRFWDKAASTVVGGLAMAALTFVLAAIGKYVVIGSVK